MISHHNHPYKLENFSELINWARQKIQDKTKDSCFIEGWGFLNKKDCRLYMQWNSNFVPDWISMGRWLKNAGLSKNILIDELQKEFQFIQHHFSQCSLDIELPDGSLLWSSTTVELLRHDHITLQKTLVPAKQVLYFEGLTKSF